MPEGASFAEVQRAALEAGVIETLKYTVKSSEIVRGPTNTHPVPFLLPVFWIFSGVVTEHFGNVTANHFAVFANE
ncbi:hypothetical protein, partial [Escherichia coli]|uniref:hypothetical protein n=1 Tax=Escherichia coli TaxID=562 RepID=UPI001F5BD5A5